MHRVHWCAKLFCAPTPRIDMYRSPCVLPHSTACTTSYCLYCPHPIGISAPHPMRGPSILPRMWPLCGSTCCGAGHTSRTQQRAAGVRCACLAGACHAGRPQHMRGSTWSWRGPHWLLVHPARPAHIPPSTAMTLYCQSFTPPARQGARPLHGMER